MVRVTDEVRVETVTAHRERLRQAYLLGDLDRRRQVSNGWATTVVSVVLAGVVCAGCVGYSFIRHALAGSASPTVAVSTTETPSPSASGRGR